MRQSFQSRGARLAFAIIAAVLVASSTVTGVGGDAGSGGDAGNTASAAYLLPGVGSYSATLPAGDDADWFALKWSYWTRPGCVEFTTTTDGIVHGTFSILSDGAVSEVGFVSTPLGDVPAGLAGASSIKGSALGVYPSISSASVSYGFGLTSVLRSNFGAGGDAGTGADAPSGASGAPTVQGGCITGRLASGDTADTFALPVTAGRAIALSFNDGGSPAVLDVRSSSGALLATVHAGDLTQIVPSVTETYTMTASSGTPTGYAIGLCNITCGPPERPCQPACELLLGD